MLKVALFVFNSFTNDSRVLKEAISLHKGGYDVAVIAHGDNGLSDEEIISDIKVARVGYLDRKVTKSKFGKLKAYFKYIVEAIKYTKTYNLFHCNDLNTLPIGVIIKKFFNRDAKIVYDAHEYETETNDLRGIQKSLTKWLEKSLIRYADKVITVNDAIANEYTRLYNIPKPSLVLNTPPYKTIEKTDIFRETFDIGREQIIFIYQGGLDSGRGIEVLLETFKMVDKNKVIVFMGYGPLENTIKEEAKNQKNIYFHQAVTAKVLLDYTSSADFGIIFYENNCLNHYYCLPNKMFEYLMAGLPVIVSNLYEIRKIVENNSIGVVATENTPTGLKQAIETAQELDKNQLINNIIKLKAIYNWEEQEKVLLRIYDYLVN